MIMLKKPDKVIPSIPDVSKGNIVLCLIQLGIVAQHTISATVVN
jgi:hypothetical protein